MTQSVTFLDSSIETGTLKQLVSADSLFHLHHLTDALSAYSSLNPNRSITINSYIKFRTNEIKQKLNMHLVYPYSILSHTDIKLNSNSGLLDSLLYFLDEINLYNQIDITAFESISHRTLTTASLPLYWKAKINLILGEYYFYEVNDLYKAYSSYTLSNTQFESLDYPTQESIYLKKDLIQLTIGQREYLVGRKYGEDMINLSRTCFKNDTILNVISNYMSGYIDRLVTPDSLYFQKYRFAARLASLTSYKKLHQTTLNSFIYSIRGKNYPILLDSLSNQLNIEIQTSDTFVNIYKTKGEELYKLNNYSKTIEFTQKAIRFLDRYKRFTPPIYLTLTSTLIDSYRQMGQFEKSNKEAYNNINFKYPFKCQNFNDILQGKADYGYFNFIIIGDLIQNLYLQYLQNQNLNNLTQANLLISKANELIDKENYSIEENRRLDMLDYSKHIYQSSMHVYYELYAKTRNSEYLESFFYFQEKTKANILYAESVEVRKKYRIPPELTQLEISLKDKIRKYRMNFTNITYVNNLYQKFDSLNEIYKLNYSSFYNARVSGSIKLLSQINIPDTILFASYSIFDNLIYTTYICDSVFITKSTYNSEFELMLDSLLILQAANKLNQNPYDQLSESALFKIIDTNKLRSKKILVFCPTGKLNGINFFTLKIQSRNKMLGEFLNVFYTFSASSMSLEGINLKDTGKTIAFSFSDLETIKSPNLILPELPGAFQNAKNISDQNPLNQIYAGKNATKKYCLASYTDSTVKHLYLALHGIANSSTRENVFLLFRTNDYKNLDTLYGYELLKYTSSTSTITLATCESTNGWAIMNEGVYNLVRYFKLNGAKKIRANYGRVSDIENKIMFTYL